MQLLRLTLLFTTILILQTATISAQISSFPYFQNFESGAGGFVGDNDWILGTPADTQISGAFSGTNAWVTNLASDYSNSTTSTLTSPVFDFSGITVRPTLSFRQNFEIETDWDAGIIEYSIDGGTSWNKVDANLGTGGTFNTTDSTGWYNNGSGSGPVGAPKFSGESTAYTGASSGWIFTTSLLPVDVVGVSDVRIRWILGSDTSVSEEGWGIDDIGVSPPNPGLIQFSSPSFADSEGNTATITVTRTLGSSGAVAISYATGGGTATSGICGSGGDYVPSSGTLSWADGESASKTFTIDLCNDAVLDDGETVNLTLSSPTGGATIGPNNPSVLTINDVLPPINSFPYFQNFESGDGGFVGDNDWEFGTPIDSQISAAFSGTNAWVTDLDGDYSTSTTSTVTSPTFDFSSLTGRPTLAFRQNFLTEDDYDAGILEYSIDGGTNWTKVDDNLGTGTTFDTTDSTGWYNNSSGSGPIGANKFSDASTAYLGASGGWILTTSSLPANVVGQANVKIRWVFGSDSSTIDEGWGIDDVGITPQNPGTIQFSSPSFAESEGDTITITATRTIGNSGAVSVTYATSDGTATGGGSCNPMVDYVGSSGTLSWADGDSSPQTFTVEICSDAVADLNETVNLTLSSPTGSAVIGPNNPAVLTITDIPPALAGTYTVGSGGDYPSLTNSGGIFDALNISGAVGPITINIIDDLTGESGSVALNEIASGSSVLIKPSGAERTITGTGTATSVIAINGADNVDINGSLVEAAGTNGVVRSLTVINPNTGPSLGIFVGSLGVGAGANNVTIRNTNIQGGTVIPGTVNSWGIRSLGADNDNLLLRNNLIQKFRYGIEAIGETAGQNNNMQILDNTIGDATDPSNSIGLTGLFIGETTGSTIARNLITNVNGNGSASLYGIRADTGTVNSSILANDIQNINYSGSSGYGGKGIEIDTGNATSNITVANNFISNITGDAYQTGTFFLDTVMGLRVRGTTGGVNIYYNSVNLRTGDFAGNTVGGGTVTTAFYVGADVTSLDVRNNIFANNLNNTSVTNDRNFAFYSDAPLGAFSTINYNDYFVDSVAPAGVLGFLGGNRAALADIQTATGQDVNSVSGDPSFASATDLHIVNTTSLLVDKGTAVPVLEDFDGQTRSVVGLAGGVPDIGGDEALAPTAAKVDVSGRALTSRGRGVPHQVVSLTGGDLSKPIYVSTNIFGYFNFTGIQAGQTYIVSIQANKVSFENPTQVITVDDNISGIEFRSNTKD